MEEVWNKIYEQIWEKGLLQWLQTVLHPCLDFLLIFQPVELLCLFGNTIWYGNSGRRCHLGDSIKPGMVEREQQQEQGRGMSYALHSLIKAAHQHKFLQQELHLTFMGLKLYSQSKTESTHSIMPFIAYRLRVARWFSPRLPMHTTHCHNQSCDYSIGMWSLVSSDDTDRTWESSISIHA